MQNLHKPGTPLLLAQLSRDGRTPAVARVLEVEYHSPANPYGSHRVKAPHTRFPITADAADLHETADAAQTRLLAKIRQAINEKAQEIDALYRAAAAYADTALIDWSEVRAAEPARHFLEAKEFIVPTEPAIITSVADLQATILSRASRQRADARLVVDNERRALDHAAHLKQVAATLKRDPHAELPPELPPLVTQTNENTLPAEPPQELDPPEPTRTRPIPGGAADDDAGDAPRPHAQPRRVPPQRTPPK